MEKKNFRSMPWQFGSLPVAGVKYTHLSMAKIEWIKKERSFIYKQKLKRFKSASLNHIHQH